MNETLKVLKERRSIRSYKPEQLREEDLQPILEAGTWAATAKNLQSPVMVVVQDPETIAHMSALNAEILGKPGTDPFFGAPTGIGSCWINRAMELFDMPEGKALLRKWGLPETYRGVGNCILGYPDGDAPAPKPRKEGWIVRP